MSRLEQLTYDLNKLVGKTDLDRLVGRHAMPLSEVLEHLTGVVGSPAYLEPLLLVEDLVSYLSAASHQHGYATAALQTPYPREEIRELVDWHKNRVDLAQALLRVCVSRVNQQMTDRATQSSENCLNSAMVGYALATKCKPKDAP
jgi:hypothetical protein